MSETSDLSTFVLNFFAFLAAFLAAFFSAFFSAFAIFFCLIILDVPPVVFRPAARRRRLGRIHRVLSDEGPRRRPRHSRYKRLAGRLNIGPWRTIVHRQNCKACCR